ncbi:MAG: hypothetical protein PHF29_00635 [Candidatus Riflebacteria bacterium]|nr:hypothetical protein [Candidatus Riflebacteria bacterium]
MKIESKMCLCLILAAALTSADAKAEPNIKNRIDATHLLAQKYKLPQVDESRTRRIKRNVKPKQKGAQETFWVNNMANNKFEQITATLQAVGRNCYIFVENTQKVSAEALKRIQTRFDNQIYSTTTANFGPENNPGLDGDSRITLLLLDIQDGYKDPNDGYVAGYFFAGDQMLQSEFESYSKVKSNEREILYIDTYPSDVNADDYLEIVAHEFQHMIHNNHDKNEATWVNEGCSQIAPVLCGYAPPGHYKLLKENPDRSLNYWAQWNPMPDYGQVYLWNQYIVDKYLHDDTLRANFFKTLVATKEKSLPAYLSAFKVIGKSFSDVFTDFSIANRINNPHLNNGQYAYKQKALKDFVLPPTAYVKAFPQKINNSVSIWGSDSYFADISKVSGTLKISFSGYRRMMNSHRPYFKVAAIKQDTAGSKPPKISFFDLQVNPGDQNRLIGEINIECDSTYDGLFLVIMALAPEEVDDTTYMPVSGFIYELNFAVEKNNVAARTPQAGDFSVEAFTQNYQRDFVHKRADDPQMREHYANLLLAAVKSDLDRGSLELVDRFIQKSQKGKGPIAFAKEIASVLLFAKSQQTSGISEEQLSERIELLNSF